MFARIAFVAVAFTASIATITACTKDDGPSCAKVVDHVQKLTKEAFGDGAGGDDRATMIARCEKQPAKARSCALAAKDVMGLAACAQP